MNHKIWIIGGLISLEDSIFGWKTLEVDWDICIWFLDHPLLFLSSSHSFWVEKFIEARFEIHFSLLNISTLSPAFKVYYLFLLTVASKSDSERDLVRSLAGSVKSKRLLSPAPGIMHLFSLTQSVSYVMSLWLAYPFHDWHEHSEYCKVQAAGSSLWEIKKANKKRKKKNRVE